LKSPLVAQKARRLSPYEECAGLSTDIAIEEDGLIATVGNVNLILPREIEPDLRPFMGKRIAILRTDIPHKLYIIRTVRLEGDEGRNQL
jgi:hypothetical protein